MPDLVTIASLESIPEAEALKLMLEADGFEVFLADDNLVAMDWLLANAIGGVKLQVESSKAQLARQKIEQHWAMQKAAREDLGPVEFACEECGQSITFPANRRGKTETCPHCKEYVDVPD